MKFDILVKKILEQSAITNSNESVLSVVENINIEGLGNVKAKVDTGNEAYNVLHGVEVKEDNDLVSFKSVNNKVLTKKKLDDIEINIGSGNVEKRPIVEIEFSLKDKIYKEPFSIADRSTNDEPVLIGEVFLKKINAVVDVGNSDPSITDTL